MSEFGTWDLVVRWHWENWLVAMLVLGASGVLSFGIIHSIRKRDP